MAGGNYEVILCERGIRTFETYTRNTMDISAIPIIHKLSHLPMTADPSHGTGRRDKVAPMARASVAAGADALLIEVHCDPNKAWSDGAQSLFPEQFVADIAGPDCAGVSRRSCNCPLRCREDLVALFLLCVSVHLRGEGLILWRFGKSRLLGRG